MTLHRTLFCALVTVLVFALINSCTDQRMSQRDPSPTQPSESDATGAGTSVAGVFSESVGRPIDRTTGLRWIENFAKANPNATKEYVIDGAALKEIMSNTSCAGISLHYATDARGSLHILPIGVDRNGKMLAMQTIATQLGRIDWQTAQQWIGNYRGYIRSHFFGTLAFARLLIDQQSLQVRVSLATNDAGAPQLLLSNASDVVPNGYEDASYLCPPTCPAI